MLVFHNPDHRVHESMSELNNGQLRRSFECPERMDFILAALGQAGLPGYEVPPQLPRALLERVHDAAFLDFLATAHDRWRVEHGDTDAISFTYPVPGLRRDAPPSAIDGALGHYGFSVDTCITRGSWQAALGAASCAHAAQGAVSAGARVAFALGRPPGHHAHRDIYGGYCYLNSAAIAAQGFRDAGAARVAILDVDYHHGNGTQAIFYDRSDVLFLSLHADPSVEFPYFLGHADETGAGAGAGYNINYPMPHGTGWDVWSQALDDAIARIQAYAPDALVISLGVDTYEKDPISQFKLTRADYPKLGARLGAIGLPSVIVMEGGYAIDDLGFNVADVLVGFANI